MQTLVASLLLTAGMKGFVPRTEATRLITLKPGVELTQVGPNRSESLDIQPDISWTEVVPSWDAEGTDNGSSIEIQLTRAGDSFTFGRWSLASEKGARSSVNKQNKATGDLYTDTFVPKTAGGPIRIRVALYPGSDGRLPKLNWVRLAFSSGLAEPAPWDQKAIIPLDVPIRAQGDYPKGEVLCSPTSVSMVLWYWAKQLNRPELDADVPAVQACVYDPAWNGTGNWSFNVAFATSRPGLSAYVARMRDTVELESWLRAGVPVITSVSYDLLKGKDKRGENDGHLVVVVGTTESGDFIFNDPGKKPNRLVYARDAFIRAWAVSTNTTYLIHPEHWMTPPLP